VDHIPKIFQISWWGPRPLNRGRRHNRQSFFLLRFISNRRTVTQTDWEKAFGFSITENCFQLVGVGGLNRSDYRSVASFSSGEPVTVQSRSRTASAVSLEFPRQ